ncbi:MAG: ABC transporter permease [Terriglobales bacterium]
MGTLGSDLRGAWRALRADRWFALATCLTLALGIGAAGGLAGAGRAAFLPRLPFARPRSLVRLYEEAPSAGIKDFPIPFMNYLAVRQVRRVFRGVALYIPPESSLALDLSAGAESGPVPGAVVSANFFRVLGVAPQVGPGFPPHADPLSPLPGTGVVISHGLWARDFGSDPRILGRPLQINGRTYTVTGVMSRGFAFPAGAQLWIAAASPGAVSAVANSRSSFSEHIPRAVARLQPGLSPARAERLLRTPLANLREMHFLGWPHVTLHLAPLAAALTGSSRRPLSLLLAGALAVLLAAWLVAAILGWVRAVRRGREMAIYAAVGGRGAAARRLFWEQVLLAAGGALASLLVAAWMARATAAVLPAPALGSRPPALGATALGAVAVLAACSVWLPGAAVLGRLRHLDLARALQSGGIALTAGRGQRRTLGAFIAILAGVGFVLAAAAGTAVYAFRRAADAPLGWQPRHTWFVSFVMHGAPAPAGQAQAAGATLAQLAQAADALPGVRAAAVAGSPPLGETGSLTVVSAPGARVSVPRGGLTPAELAVSTGYFRAMGIGLVAGRPFRPEDFSPHAAPVAVVDQTMARDYWGSAANAVGEILRTANGSLQNTRIIGVAATTRANYGYFQPNYPTAYVPAPGALAPSVFTLVLRMDGDAPPAPADIRGMFQQIRPSWTPAPAVAASRLLALQAGPFRAQSETLLLFALLALALLFLGSISVVSFVAEARVRELGIRLALGASPRRITATVAGQTAWPLLIGLTAGMAGAVLWLGPVAHLLGYGVHGLPVTVLALAAGVCAAGALPAAWRQHWRLRTLDPSRILRQE